jgi:hypothetical protein
MWKLKEIATDMINDHQKTAMTMFKRFEAGLGGVVSEIQDHYVDV